MTSDNVLLQIKNLKTGFHTGDGYVQAVRGVSFYVDRGERLGIVGESGCGKSVSMLSIMHLLEDNADLNVDEIMFDGEDLAKKSVKEMRKYQGNEISMIFQDPMTSLNPLFTIGEQICGPLRRHLKMSKAQARERALEVLNQVGIPAPEKRIHQYPHELSGGMRQRVMIAIAIACNPKLLIADEPTTALDVTIQAHPYTKGLLESIPKANGEKLVPIFGTPPDLLNPPAGCPFAARCPYAMKLCHAFQPKLDEVEEGHKSACWLHHPQVKKNIEVPDLAKRKRAGELKAQGKEKEGGVKLS